MNTQNKYAIYCRVSTDEQTNENQLIRLTEYCDQHGFNFDTFEEKESTRNTRPIKQQLLQKLRNGEYKGVIIYKLDRWARSLIELVTEITELIKKEIEFISVSDNIDFTTAQGRLQMQLLGAFSEFERALISSRTKEGLRRKELKENYKKGRQFGAKDKKKRKPRTKINKPPMYMTIDNYGHLVPIGTPPVNFNPK